ncbi:MAG TPA: PQQ-binding-like beta-propeller repeat protein [Tepidisphaeraceae bacterium]|nr:PQQ-binding-like beta-propeller repeat protein [Tepidisphaeraceae bacterium]
MNRINCRRFWAVAGLLAAGLAAPPAPAADQPQWGRKDTRNMVSDEKGLPDSFDPATGKNIKWVAELGTQSYATPIVASGRVFIGTNNEKPRDPRQQGDRGVLMCLDEKDGHLVWQLVVPKLSADEHDPYLDWPQAGMASAPTVEGNRVYTLTNRGEVVCLDLLGMANGNDGPYKDEAKHLAPRGMPPIEPGPKDADIIWLTDLVSQAGIHTHDQVHGSILIDGDLLYVNSCNGVDNTHRVIRSPDAPSLVVLDKKTGRIVARDDQRIGPNIFHCTWSSPALGEVNGRRLIFFGGDDGICYAFDALKALPPAGEVAKLHNVWKFDCDPTAPKQDIHKYVGNRKQSPSVIMGMPVFDHGRIYVTCGGDLWWGKRQGWIKCIDPGKTGDVTQSALLWLYPLSKDTCATPAVYDGMVFATDCGGMVHCVDAQTGKPIWTQKISGGEIWASTLVADGKVYVGTRRGEFVVLAASREKKVLSTIDLGEGIAGTATAANGTLYVATMGHLYAVAKK